MKFSRYFELAAWKIWVKNWIQIQMTVKFEIYFKIQKKYIKNCKTLKIEK